MSDTTTPDATQPQSVGTTVIHNEYLRLMIREAVDRELINQIAPIRSQQQINAGSITQLNRDYGVLAGQLIDLGAIVRGDEKLGIRGLMRTTEDLGTQLKALQVQLNAQSDKLNDMSMYIRVGFAVLIALGLIDSERVGSFIGSILRAMGVGL